MRRISDPSRMWTCAFRDDSNHVGESRLAIVFPAINAYHPLRARIDPFDISKGSNKTTPWALSFLRSQGTRAEARRDRRRRKLFIDDRRPLDRRDHVILDDFLSSKRDRAVKVVAGMKALRRDKNIYVDVRDQE